MFHPCPFSSCVLLPLSTVQKDGCAFSRLFFVSVPVPALKVLRRTLTTPWVISPSAGSQAASFFFLSLFLIFLGIQFFFYNAPPFLFFSLDICGFRTSPSNTFSHPLYRSVASDHDLASPALQVLASACFLLFPASRVADFLSLVIGFIPINFQSPLYRRGTVSFSLPRHKI